MSLSNNIAQVNINPLENKDTYFNNYFMPNYTVSSEIDGVVISFFESMTGNKETAKVLASAVIFTSLAQKMNPMEVLKQFESIPMNKLNAYVAMFLNLNRVGTSLLGVNNEQKISKYVQRSILV